MIKNSQNYGEHPLSVRNSDFYIHKYVDGFVRKWDELINWENRTKLEADFLIDCLKKRSARDILDVATGTGFHSINLVKFGFYVTSVDGSPAMLEQAVENGHKHGVALNTALTDWRTLNLNLSRKFDSIVCMGNSFTFLFEEHNHRKVLDEFYLALKPDGVLILDHRNYDAILAGKYYHLDSLSCYSGKNVRIEPEYVDEGLTRFAYEFPDGAVFHLNMFPLRKSYVSTLLKEAGFESVEVFGDFKPILKIEMPGFYIHVADKIVLGQ